MLFSNLKAQKQNQFNKISVSFIQASTDQGLNDKTKGLKFEYYLNLKKRYGILNSSEGSSFNNIPAIFFYGDENNINANEIKIYEILFRENKSISQMVFASHFY